MSQATNGYDPEAEFERAQSQQEFSQTSSTAQQQASQAAPDWSELQSKEFIDTAFEPSVNRPDGENFDNNRIEERFAAEFGRHAGLSNITRDDWEDEKLLNEAKALLAKQEYARPSGLGSRCTPGLRNAMTGQDALPILDDDLSREIHSTFDERTNLQALSIDARGFRGLTEVTAVSRSEGFDGPSNDDGGWLNRLTGGLFGGA
jgi:hypothetical protein